MRTADLTEERLAKLIDRFPSRRIAVVGDFFLDKYLDVDPALEEASIETGKPAHQVIQVRCSPGAAGTVVSNLASLGTGQLYAIGFTGDDGEGYDLRKALTRLGCSIDHLHVSSDRSTPTYLKPRDATEARLAAEHSRYDTKNRRPTPRTLEHQIIRSIDRLLSGIDAIAVMDQVEERDCGVVTGAVREAVADRASRFPDVTFWADSRRRIREFRGVIVKPNQFEAVGDMTRSPDDNVDLEKLEGRVAQLRSQVGAPVVTTCGPRGMVVSDPVWTVVPGLKVEAEIDPTGAGDSATAGTLLALCAGASLPEAAVVGNLVASITVEQIATTGVARPEQLPPRLRLWRAQQGKRSR